MANERFLNRILPGVYTAAWYTSAPYGKPALAP
jgi:hypothetical protein